MYNGIAKRVLTPECRLSYANLVEPKAAKDDPNGKKFYSVALLIPKSQAIFTELKNSEKAAYDEAITSKWGGKRPQITSVIHDGDLPKQNGDEYGPECKGHYVINVKSKNKPWVCHQSNINCELAPQDIYSGMYARVTIEFFGYDTNGRKGVSASLRGVMKTRDGEPLSEAVVTASEFEGVGASPETEDNTIPMTTNGYGLI